MPPKKEEIKKIIDFSTYGAIFAGKWRNFAKLAIFFILIGKKFSFIQISCFSFKNNLYYTQCVIYRGLVWTCRNALSVILGISKLKKN